MFPPARPAPPLPPPVADLEARRERFDRVGMALAVVGLAVGILAAVFTTLDPDLAWKLLLLAGLVSLGTGTVLMGVAGRNTLDASDRIALYQLLYSLPGGHDYYDRVDADGRAFVREDLDRLRAYQQALVEWSQAVSAYAAGRREGVGAMPRIERGVVGEPSPGVLLPGDETWWHAYRTPPVDGPSGGSIITDDPTDRS